MPDFFHVYFCPDVTAETASELGATVVKALQSQELISIDRDDESALGRGPAYRPDARIAEHYTGDCHWTTLLTNGMAIRAGEYLNVSSVLTANYYRCPNCNTEFEINLVESQLVDAIGAYYESGSIGQMQCSNCEASTLASAWTTDVPLGLSHLAFVFYNWPIFASRIVQHPDGWEHISEHWQIDVPTIISQVTGSKVGWSYGRI